MFSQLALQVPLFASTVPRPLAETVADDGRIIKLARSPVFVPVPFMGAEAIGVPAAAKSWIVMGT